MGYYKILDYEIRPNGPDCEFISPEKYDEVMEVFKGTNIEKKIITLFEFFEYLDDTRENVEIEYDISFQIEAKDYNQIRYFLVIDISTNKFNQRIRIAESEIYNDREMMEMFKQFKDDECVEFKNVNLHSLIEYYIEGGSSGAKNIFNNGDIISVENRNVFMTDLTLFKRKSTLEKLKIMKTCGE